jgi:hypothetical protein
MLSNYIILGIAIAGLELIYQKLMFPGHPLHWWFKILHKMKWSIRNSFGYCHFCNSVWLAMIIHYLFYGIGIEIIITIGITYVVLSLMLPIKWLIYNPNNNN